MTPDFRRRSQTAFEPKAEQLLYFCNLQSKIQNPKSKIIKGSLPLHVIQPFFQLSDVINPST
jgi:hypothetical protein